MQYRKSFFSDARRSTGCIPLRCAGIWSALAFSSLILLSPCFAQAESLTIGIPAQPLAAALDSLAIQTGIKLSYVPEMVKGKRAPALAEGLTADEALGRLLAGSDFMHVKTDGAYAVTPAGNETAEAAKEEPVAQLPLIVVSEKTEETGYIARRASTATKTNTPIMLTPFSIQVVPKEVIQDQQAIRLEDVTKNVSGVQTNWGYGGLYEGFALRGFETNNILRNGQRIGGGFGRSSIDMANIEMVEVLKGPAAMIYGRLDPGGMINVVTKKPMGTPYYSLQQQFGSFNTFRTTADATGRINSDGTLLYRINFEYLDANSFRPQAPHTYSTFVAPSLSWRPNSDLEVNLNYEHRNLEPSLDNGVPAVGNRPANISIKTYGGDIKDRAIVNRNLVDFNWAYAINPSWKVRNGLTGTFETINFKQSYFPSFVDNSIAGTLIVNNSPWIGLRQSQGFNTFFDVTGNFKVWGSEHTLLAGTDYYVLDHRDTEYVAGFGVVDTIDLLHPTYNRTTNPANLRAQSPDFLSIGRQEWNGLYLQDQITLWDKVHLLLGGRYDWAQSTRGTVVTEFSPNHSFADLQKTTINDEKFSPRLGLLYQPVSWLSLFGNYTEALSGNAGQLASGAPMHAQRSRSYEAGVKAEAFDGRLISTLAFFEIFKTNLSTPNLATFNPVDGVGIGEARSRGIELDITGQVTKDLNLIATYAYTDARISKDTSTLGLLGHRLANVPVYSGSVWARYQVFSGFSVGAGAFYRGDRFGNNENNFTLPAYTRVDMFAAYTQKIGQSKLTAQLNINNLLNTRYYMNSNVLNEGVDPRTSIMPGAPLTVMGSLRLQY